MVATAGPDKPTPRADGGVVIPLGYRSPDAGETAFRRADLVFDGVAHATDSYEVRVFLNNAAANAGTPRTREAGYAGRFNVFGHGGCFGGGGHCEIDGAPTATDARSIAAAVPHPLTPQTKTVTVTGALKQALSEHDGRLETVTLVPIRRAPRPADSGPTADLFSYDRIRLQTYR